MTAAIMEELEERIKVYGPRDTLRCLVLALRPIPMGLQKLTHEDERNLTFVGVVGMLDPPRQEVRKAIASRHGHLGPHGASMRRLKACVTLILLVMGALTLEVEARSVSPGAGLDRVHRKQQSSMAYVTLLYGDDFLLGVRVLGESIRNTGTTKDMVALVSKGVSAEAMELLEADGWIITPIELLANPNSNRPARFWGVYTKLKIFNMTFYEKVLFLDADTIVTQNIEDLFECQKFCANLKHSERLNSGVLVVEPSSLLFEDMLSKVGTLRSYTGGDQGFLNSYYNDFANAQLFNPNMPPEERKTYNPAMERLSTLYNADVGLYALANKWMVDNTSELRVVHYTLGPLKPWDWWTHWLLKPVDLWQDIRVTLPESLPGTRAGQTPHTRLLVRVMFLLPLVIAAFFSRRFLCQVHQDLCGLFCTGGYARQLWYKYTSGSPLPKYATMSGSPSHNPTQQYANGSGGTSGNGRLPAYLGSLPAYLGSLSIIVCFSCLLLSFGIAILLIPKQVMPWTGMILAYEWSLFGFVILFGKYLDLVNAYGRKFAVVTFPSGSLGENFSQYNSSKGHTRQSATLDMGTALYGTGILALAIAVPSVSFLLGVNSIFGRLGLTVAVGIIFAAFLAHAAEHLAIRWYLRG